MKIDFSTLYSGQDGDPRSPLARAFCWLTRSGIGRKFGSLPIGWFQMHQCEGLDLLKERAQAVFGTNQTAFDMRARQGLIEARPIDPHYLSGRKWQTLGTVRDLFTETDRRARK